MSTWRFRWAVERPASRWIAERRGPGAAGAGARPAVICGEASTQLVARPGGGGLEIECRPREGGGDIPFAARLQGADLVWEVWIAMGESGKQQTAATDTRDLYQTGPGDTRRAGTLLAADSIRFVFDLAANHHRATNDSVGNAPGSRPSRQAMVGKPADNLRVRDRLVSGEYL